MLTIIQGPQVSIIEKHDRVAALEWPSLLGADSSMIESVTAETRSGEISIP